MRRIPYCHSFSIDWIQDSELFLAVLPPLFLGGVSPPLDPVPPLLAGSFLSPRLFNGYPQFCHHNTETGCFSAPLLKNGAATIVLALKAVSSLALVIFVLNLKTAVAVLVYLDNTLKLFDYIGKYATALHHP